MKSSSSLRMKEIKREIEKYDMNTSSMVLALNKQPVKTVRNKSSMSLIKVDENETGFISNIDLGPPTATVDFGETKKANAF